VDNHHLLFFHPLVKHPHLSVLIVIHPLYYVIFLNLVKTMVFVPMITLHFVDMSVNVYLVSMAQNVNMTTGHVNQILVGIMV
jgi:hypothetical protein